jgi:hypothetical protein
VCNGVRSDLVPSVFGPLQCSASNRHFPSTFILYQYITCICVHRGLDGQDKLSEEQNLSQVRIYRGIVLQVPVIHITAMQNQFYI